MRGRVRDKINNLHDKVRDLSRDVGSPEDLSFEGRGTSRIVFQIESDRFGSENRGCVIKFAMNGNGRLDNRLEHETWNSVRDTELQSFFCPVKEIDTNYEWIIMDYCKDAKGNPSIEGFKRTLIERIGKTPDLQDENIGIHGKKGLVVRDYSWGSDVSAD